MSGKKFFYSCLVVVLFLFFSGIADAKKQSVGTLIETGCYGGNIPIEAIFEMIKKDYFGSGDCVRFDHRLATAPKKLMELLREFKWSLYIIRGYAATPEEGCTVARGFISELQKEGWKPSPAPTGFELSCHSDSFGNIGVEIFIWNLPE